MTKAISIKNIYRKKIETMNLPKFDKTLGEVEFSGCWIIFGKSGNGKTTFTLDLLSEIAKYKKCIYCSLEEKSKGTFQKAVKSANLLDVNSNVQVYTTMTVQDLEIVLAKKRSPEVVFFDSLQLLRINKESANQLTVFQFQQMTEKHPTKLFIFLSHQGNGANYPKGALGDFVFHMSDICIHVENRVATPVKNRYGGTASYQTILKQQS